MISSFTDDDNHDDADDANDVDIDDVMGTLRSPADI